MNAGSIEVLKSSLGIPVRNGVVPPEVSTELNRIASNLGLPKFLHEKHRQLTDQCGGNKNPDFWVIKITGATEKINGEVGPWLYRFMIWPHINNHNAENIEERHRRDMVGVLLKKYGPIIVLGKNRKVIPIDTDSDTVWQSLKEAFEEPGKLNGLFGNYIPTFPNGQNDIGG